MPKKLDTKINERREWHKNVEKSDAKKRVVKAFKARISCCAMKTS